MTRKKQSKHKKSTPKKVPALKKPASRIPVAKATKHTTISRDTNRAGNENKPVLPDFCSDEWRLKELACAVRVHIIVSRIWNTYFSAAERRRIINDNLGQRVADDDSMWPNIVGIWAKSNLVFDLVGIWAKFKGISRKKAILEIAYEGGCISEQELRRLLRSFDLDTESAKGQHPEWDKELGVLRLEGKIIKRIRRLATASNVTIILDAFQGDGWPSYIDDPLTTNESLEQTPAQRLQDVAKSLNRNLTMIRFRSANCGDGIAWERV